MGLLTGQTIVSTYEQLLKITSEDIDSNANAKFIEDGKGAASALAISQHRVGVGTATPDAILEVEQGASGGQIAFLINNDDDDKVAMHIDAANITADVLDITANVLTTHNVIDISATGLTDGKLINTASTSTVTDGGTSTLVATAMTNDGVGSQTAKGVFLDYNKSGVTASGKTANVSGMHIDMDDAATNHASGTVNMTGLDIDVTSANAQGTIKNIGLDVAVAGADTNYAALFSGGHVGIGTASPNVPLDIEENIADEAHMARFMDGTMADGDFFSIGLGQASGTNYKFGLLQFKLGTSGSSTAYADSLIGLGLVNNNFPFCVNGYGKVGIGTITQEKRLHIAHDSGTTEYPLMVQNPNATAGARTGILFEVYDQEATIEVERSGANYGVDMRFLLADSSDGTKQERLTILESGNVGIGLLTPLNTLSVSPVQYTSTMNASQSGTTVTAASGTPFTTAMEGAHFIYADGTSSGIITTRTDSTHVEVATSQTVSAQLFRIHYQGLNVKNNGKVGIGDSDPPSNLHVKAALGTGGVSIGLQGIENAQDYDIDYYLNSADNIYSRIRWSEGSTDWKFQSNVTDGIFTPMIINYNATGNVGIGTVTPGELLEVAKSAADAVVELSCWSTSEGHNSRLVFQKSGSATIDTLVPTEINENLGIIEFYGVNNAATPAKKMGAYILAEQDAAKDATAVPTRLLFATSDADDDGSPTERMRIDDAGNIGMGTTTPDPSSAGWGNTLTVAHTSTEPAIELWLNNASISDEARIGQINFMSGTTAKINACINAVQNGTAEAEAHLTFRTRDSGDSGGTPDERMRITSDGYVGIGIDDPDNPLEVLAVEGQGIKLASSHDESVLVHLVEEGTAGRIRVSDAGSTKVQIEATANASSYINNGGKLGIGNASPAGALNISGAGVGANIYVDAHSADGDGSNLIFRKSRNATVGSHTLANSGDILGQIYFQGSDGDSYETGGAFRALTTENWSGSARGTKLEFYTVDNTTTTTDLRMTIQHDGEIVLPRVYHTDHGGGTTRDCLVKDDGSMGYSSSSRVFKENIESMSDVSWLYSLNPVTFNYKESDRLSHGLIAEEVWNIKPELCYLATEEEKIEHSLETDAIGVDYKSFVPALIKVVQELSAKVTALENA